MEAVWMVLGVLGGLAFIALVVWAAIASAKAAKARREAMAAFAAELGGVFRPGLDHGHDDEFQHFECFRNGFGRAAYNTINGSIEVADRAVRIKAGDYRYKTKSTNSKGQTTTTTHRFSYAILETPLVEAPSLLIKRENFMHRFLDAFGGQDIDFESEEFSRRFLVKSGDKRFAFRVIHPRMMDFLMGGADGAPHALGEPPAVDFEHGRLLITDGSRTWKPERFRWAIAWADAFFSQFPRDVWSGEWRPGTGDA